MSDQVIRERSAFRIRRGHAVQIHDGADGDASGQAQRWHKAAVFAVVIVTVLGADSAMPSLTDQACRTNSPGTSAVKVGITAIGLESVAVLPSGRRDEFPGEG